MVKLTEEQKSGLKSLEAMPDDQIDFSDIPEMTPVEWSKGKRGMFYQPAWRGFTLTLDETVVDWFNERASDPEKVDKDINQALTEHIRRERFPDRKPSRNLTD